MKDFLAWAKERIPLGPWHFPEDQLTDLTLALTAAEVTREKLFLRIHDEIPYNATVETEKFTIQKDGSYRIDQVIYVTRDTHKKIVLGAGGQTIKAIGADSRKELMEIFEVPVHLFLFVKVREKWGDDPERYREMGLDYGQKGGVAVTRGHVPMVACSPALFPVEIGLFAYGQCHAMDWRGPHHRRPPPRRDQRHRRGDGRRAVAVISA